MQIRRNYYVQKDRLRPGVFHFCQCRPALPASLAAPLRLAGGSKSPLHVLERPLGAPATQGPRWQRWAGRRGPHRSWNVRPTHLACKADPLSPLCPGQVLGGPRGGGAEGGGLQAAHCGSPTPWWLPRPPSCPQGSDSWEPQQEALGQDLLACSHAHTSLEGGLSAAAFRGYSELPSLAPSGLGGMTP